MTLKRASLMQEGRNQTGLDLRLNGRRVTGVSKNRKLFLRSAIAKESRERQCICGGFRDY